MMLTKLKTCKVKNYEQNGKLRFLLVYDVHLVYSMHTWYVICDIYI